MFKIFLVFSFFGIFLLAAEETSSSLTKQRIEVMELKKELNNFESTTMMNGYAATSPHVKNTRNNVAAEYKSPTSLRKSISSSCSSPLIGFSTKGFSDSGDVINPISDVEHSNIASVSQLIPMLTKTHGEISKVRDLIMDLCAREIGDDPGCRQM